MTTVSEGLNARTDWHRGRQGLLDHEQRLGDVHRKLPPPCPLRHQLHASLLRCICRFLAHRVGSLRRTDSVAIEGIADIRRGLAARRSDANDPDRSSALVGQCTAVPRFRTIQACPRDLLCVLR